MSLHREEECDIVRKEAQREEGGDIVRRGSNVRKNGGSARADPESLDAHLDPLESCTEWDPTLKVLTRHKNGANTPRCLIINEL